MAEVKQEARYLIDLPNGESMWMSESLLAKYNRGEWDPLNPSPEEKARNKAEAQEALKEFIRRKAASEAAQQELVSPEV